METTHQSRYQSRQALANKIDWEGGLEEFLFGYGCRPEDMPDQELEDLVRELYDKTRPLLNKFANALPYPGEIDEL